MISKKEQFYQQRIAELQAENAALKNQVAELLKVNAELAEQVAKLTDYLTDILGRIPTNRVISHRDFHRTNVLSLAGSFSRQAYNSTSPRADVV